MNLDLNPSTFHFDMFRLEGIPIKYKSQKHPRILISFLSSHLLFLSMNMFVFTQYRFVLCALLHLAAGGPAAQRRPTFDHFRRPGFATTQQSSTTSVAATVAQSSTQVTAVSIPSLKDAAASSIQSSNASAGAIPPVAASIGTVTNATLTKPWGITRDGGGGGTIDGTHIINFSDTGADGNNAFVSNSIATTNTVR